MLEALDTWKARRYILLMIVVALRIALVILTIALVGSAKLIAVAISAIVKKLS